MSFIRLSSQFFFCSVVSSIERVNLVGRPLVGYVLFDRCTPPNREVRYYLAGIITNTRKKYNYIAIVKPSTIFFATKIVQRLNLALFLFCTDDIVYDRN